MSRKRGFWGGEEETQTPPATPDLKSKDLPTFSTTTEVNETKGFQWYPDLEIKQDEITSYEELSKESKSIAGLSELFDGFKFIFNKGISDNLSVNHSIGLGGAMEPATYNFGANYTWNRTFFWGQIDTDGHLFGKYHQSFNKDRTLLKVTTQISNEPHGSGVQVELDHKGSNWSGMGRWVNPGTYGVGFLQYITRNFCLGTDMHYIHKQGLTVPTIGMRYALQNTIWTAILAPHVWNITYTRNFNNRVGLSTDLSFNITQNGWEPQWSLGYEYRLTMSMFRGHVDSSGRVAGMLEEQLNQFTKFVLCGDLDYAKNQYRFGLGIQMQL